MSHTHEHNHAHSHGHHSHSGDIERSLLWALIITAGIFLLEIVGGLLSNSLALLSDAGHLFGDVLALGLSFVAAKIAKLPPSSKRTYGYHRIEVLAAIFNGLTLFLLAGFIFYKAYQRLLKPEPVESFLMLGIAVIGLIANIVVMKRLHGAASSNLNVRAAFLHVLGDMLGSVGVVAGGLIMLTTGSYMADPIISFFVGAIILYGAFGVLREGAHILLEGVPYSVNYEKLKADMEKVDGVISVHDLHVWTISSANLALSSHIKVNNQDTHASQQILSDTREMLGSAYGIFHATLQIECDCCTDSNCGCMGSSQL
jgi:cobalt-zinc-cadmium efflux system protein